MIDFLFITSPTNAPVPHPPYYFLYLAAYLRSKGLTVKIIDVTGGHSLEKHYTTITNELRQTPSRFVGLAAFHPDYSTIMRLGNIVKNIQKDTTLLVGNAHATISPEDFIFEGSPFDIAVLGEGEETCYELWKWYEAWDICHMDDLDKVGGIVYYENKLVRTAPRPFLDLSTLPIPDYSMINMDFYLKVQKIVLRRIYTSIICVPASRGCPFNCDFCAANTVWKANTGKPTRLRPVGHVIGELLALRHVYKLDFFYLYDDMFGINKKWMLEFFDKKTRTDQVRGDVFPYATQTRADVATEEMIRGLKETGCIQLDIGVEAGSQRLLDKVNKNITLQQVRQVFSWCAKYKIRSFATMLINLPTETTKDLKTTYQFLKEIKPSAGVIFGITTPYPGTKIYEDHFPTKPTREDYHRLFGKDTRLYNENIIRLAAHDLDLEVLWNKWNRKFKATPMFERMWALQPLQKLYWKQVLRSSRRHQYLLCWLVDIPRTFIIWWIHKLRLYRLVKRLTKHES